MGETTNASSMANILNFTSMGVLPGSLTHVAIKQPYRHVCLVFNDDCPGWVENGEQLPMGGSFYLAEMY